MAIGTICNSEVAIAHKKNSVLEAARLMRKRHVGDLIVTEAREGRQIPVGVLTDRDIVVEVIAKGRKAEELQVGDIMSQNIVTANENDGVFETIQLMRMKGIRRLPIVRDTGEMIGVISLDDLLELLAEEMSTLSKIIGRERAEEARARQ